jgi:hypothetical protein
MYVLGGTDFPIDYVTGFARSTTCKQIKLGTLTM